MGRPYAGQGDDDPRKGKTGVDLDVLKDIGAKLTDAPDDLKPTARSSAFWPTAKQ
jgi:hypothetical protein